MNTIEGMKVLNTTRSLLEIHIGTANVNIGISTKYTSSTFDKTDVFPSLVDTVMLRIYQGKDLV